MSVGTPVNTSGNSATPALSATAGAAGDIVLGAISMDNGSSTISGLGAWTTLLTGNLTFDGHLYWLGWKRLAGADSGTTVTASAAGGNYVSSTVPVLGRHTTNPPVAGTTSISNAANSSPVVMTAPAITALSGDDILQFAFPDVNTASAANGFSGWGLGTEIVDIEGPAAAEWANIGVAKVENVGAGTTGTKAVTLTLAAGASGYMTALVRIPAAAVSQIPPCARRNNFRNALRARGNFAR